MSRTSSARLLRLASDLGERERGALDVVAKLRLVSHAQISLLLVPSFPRASAASAARAVRRMLAQLTELGVLARLERRVGGVRAGSGGFVYYVGPVGQRLLAYWEGRGLIRGRSRPEPGGRYVHHRLSVSQLFVELRAADASGELDLLGFESEPDCWRRYVDGFGGSVLLKPDAFVRVGVGAYEDRCFVEVDLGTESRTVIGGKTRSYRDYFQTGSEQAEHGVFPRVVLLTNSQARQRALREVVVRLPTEHRGLFAVGLLDQAVAVISGQAAAASDELADDRNWS